MRHMRRDSNALTVHPDYRHAYTLWWGGGFSHTVALNLRTPNLLAQIYLKILLVPATYHMVKNDRDSQ
jgi:hypothetical protein